LRRQAAGVSVPHIADDYGCLCHVPAERAFGDLIASPADSEIQGPRHFGAVQHRFLRLRCAYRRRGQHGQKRPSSHLKLLISPKTIMLTAVNSSASAHPANPDIARATLVAEADS